VIYLLDTTLLVDVANGLPAAKRALEELIGQPNTLLTCDAVVAEALSGGDDTQLRFVRNLISVLEYVSTDAAAAAWAGESRRAARRTSARTLGDALIAAVAWSNKATIVTRNPDDFVRQGIPVLKYG
jgi:predicted nucleic acid-binding protein